MATRRKPNEDSTSQEPRKETRGRKKGHEPAGMAAWHNPSVPEGYNTKMARFVLEVMPTEPLDPNDVEEMKRRFRHYLDKCAEYDVKIGNQGAYAAIGIDKDIAWEWVNRSSANPARSGFVKSVQKFCAFCRENLMSDGKVNPVVGIFWQKNYDGLKDQQEVVLTPNQSPLGAQKDAEELKKRYLDNTYGLEATPVAPALPDGEASTGSVLTLPESDSLPLDVRGNTDTV